MNMRSFLSTCVCFTLCATSAFAQTNSVLICRAKQCADASQTMSKEYLFNQMTALLNKNIGSSVLLCEANPQTHVCLEKGISFNAQSSLIQAIITIPSARIVDAKPLTKETGIDMILDYKVQAGGTYPRCQTALSRLGVADPDNVQMMSPSFACHLTETADTVLSIVYNIDYVDFDYGTFGAYYSAASGLALPGGKSGYMLMRFTQPGTLTLNDAFPMNAVAQGAQQGTQQGTQAETGNTLDPVWMKPTPFLNMETPVFMPQDCATTEQGCSAQAVNAYATGAVPLTDTVSTTGLIQQNHEYIDPKKGATKVVLTRKQIIENGQARTIEEKVQHFVQETPDSPFVEKTDGKSQKTTQQEVKTATQPTKATPKQEAKAPAQQPAPAAVKPVTQPVAQGIPTATIPVPAQASDNPALVVPNHTIPTEQLLNAQPQEQIVLQQQLPEGVTPEVYAQAVQMAQTNNVAINMPQGVVLTDQEQSYIQQMPVPQQALPAGYVPQQQAYAPTVAQPAYAPASNAQDPFAVEEKAEPSFWDKVEKFFYF